MHTIYYITYTLNSLKWDMRYMEKLLYNYNYIYHQQCSLSDFLDRQTLGHLSSNIKHHTNGDSESILVTIQLVSDLTPITSIKIFSCSKSLFWVIVLNCYSQSLLYVEWDLKLISENITHLHFFGLSTALIAELYQCNHHGQTQTSNQDVEDSRYITERQSAGLLLVKMHRGEKKGQADRDVFCEMLY